MRMTAKHIRGSVLPTAVTATVVMTVAMTGLIALWEQERMAVLHDTRLRQAQADAISACMLYCLHPDDSRLTASGGYRLYDSLPRSRVYVRPEPWGLYELVKIATSDSLVCQCHIIGAAPPADMTLYYADNGTALTIAGDTRLHGTVHLPKNGLVYGRMESEFYNGGPVPASTVRRSQASLPPPDPKAVEILRNLFVRPCCQAETVPYTAEIPLSADSTLFIAAGTADITRCSLTGRIVVTGDEIRIDSTCRLHNIIVCARKVTVDAGARITIQIVARDTAVVKPRAALQYPSGIYAGRYAELGCNATLDGYAIVCDTVQHPHPSACYRQAPTARLRGLLYVDGTAEVRGRVTGSAYLRSAASFSQHGYYTDMLYDARLRDNHVTAHPIWIADSAVRRKEVACIN